MSRRVRGKTAAARLNGVDLNGEASCSNYVRESIDNVVTTMASGQDRAVDWSCMPYDTMSDIFASLNYRDRASLACVCKTWSFVASFPSLWKILDLRPHTLNVDMAVLLAKRCQSLQILKVRGDTVTFIRELQAKALRYLTWEECSEHDMQQLSSDMHKGMIRYEALESLQVSTKCVRGGRYMFSKAISKVTMCTPNLKRLRLSRIRDMDAETVESLVKPCPELTELAFLSCNWIHPRALNPISSCSWGLRFLSVAGSKGLSWSVATTLWSKLPNLIAIDASRTSIYPADAARLVAAPHLKVLCALECRVLERQMLQPSPENANFVRELRKSKGLLSRLTNVLQMLEGLDAEQHLGPKLRDWMEWILSNALLRMAEGNSARVERFWLTQGAALALKLLESKQEDVQERGVTALATFLSIGDQNSRKARTEAIMQRGGLVLLLNLAKSSQEAVQSESAKAIGHLCKNAELAEAVVMDGGIQVCATLARSRNCWVAAEAAGALWNLSAGKEHKVAIAHAGAIEALVNIASKWASQPGRGDEEAIWSAAGARADLTLDIECRMEVGRVHEIALWRASGALADLTSDTECRMEVASAGGVDALIRLLRFCNNGKVQEQAAQALSNLSLSENIREAIAISGGVETLIDIAQRWCDSGSEGLLANTAGALWNLSKSEAISTFIGAAGGVAPLIALVHFDSVRMHKNAAGALWNLAINPDNILLIVEENGVPALIGVCLSSESKMARFLAALGLAYILDGRLDEKAAAALFEGNSADGIYVSTHIYWASAKGVATKTINVFLQEFSKRELFQASTPPSLYSPIFLSQAAESIRIEDADCLLCSAAQLERFLAMLKNWCGVLQTCAIFALLQFTMPGGVHTYHHVNLLQVMGANQVLRRIAAATTTSLQVKFYTRVVLHNLERCPVHVAFNL